MLRTAAFLGVALTVVFASHAGVASAEGARPTFDCAKATGQVEQLICADSSLAALDVKIDRVWRAVLSKCAKSPELHMIRAEQRGWVKGRNDCWKSADIAACVRSNYLSRISELQARWRLVPSRGPTFYACDGDPANEVVVTLFDSDIPVAIMERGDQTSVAYLDSTSAERRYVGRNETMVLTGDTARITWGYGATTMTCKPR